MFAVWYLLWTKEMLLTSTLQWFSSPLARSGACSVEVSYKPYITASTVKLTCTSVINTTASNHSSTRQHGKKLADYSCNWDKCRSSWWTEKKHFDFKHKESKNYGSIHTDNASNRGFPIRLLANYTNQSKSVNCDNNKCNLLHFIRYLLYLFAHCST